MLTRRFYFGVAESLPNDQESPICSIIEDTLVENCEEVALTPERCDQRRWTGRFRVQVNLLKTSK